MSRKIVIRRCPQCHQVSKAPGSDIPSFTLVKGNPRKLADTDELMCNHCGAISTIKEVKDYN